jgi:cytochrome P450
MRELCPVAHSDQHGGYWVVTEYEDVLAVLQDWQTFSSAHGLNIPQTPGVVRNLPVEADPPEQRIYKRIINPYFTPASVSVWEQGMRELVRRLADGFLAKGECDFMNDFARPFPSLGFFEFAIGAPAEEIEHVAYLASKSSTPKDPAARECWQGLYEWIDAFTKRRRSEPSRGDVVDAVNAATFDGRPLTQDEIIGIVQLLVLGGLETTAAALGQMFERFAHEPELADTLRTRPELIPSAIEELLRVGSPFIAVARTAMKDSELGGQHIKAGDKVLISFASANADEGEFEHADQFDLDRERNRHIAFGLGPHRCAGSNLARMNLRLSLEELLPRMTNIAIAPRAEIPYHSTLTRSPLSLPLTFTPGVTGG